MPLYIQNIINHFKWIDASCLVFIPALLLCVWAHLTIKRTYRIHRDIESKHEKIGSQVVKELLKSEGVKKIEIKIMPGLLTDHYDDENKALGLSTDVYYGDSIMAIGVAAHEAGHAIQYARHPGGIRLRNIALVPVNIAANLSIPFILLGLIFSFELVGKTGIYLFFLSVCFHLLTLPIELQASNIAFELLEKKHYFEPEEKEGIRKVLHSTALTYLAYTPMAFIHLVRLIVSSSRS
jgi:Zn-dependent membrane protease YugP